MGSWMKIDGQPHLLVFDPIDSNDWWTPKVQDLLGALLSRLQGLRIILTGHSSESLGGTLGNFKLMTIHLNKLGSEAATLFTKRCHRPLFEGDFDPEAPQQGARTPLPWRSDALLQKLAASPLLRQIDGLPSGICRAAQ